MADADSRSAHTARAEIRKASAVMALEWRIAHDGITGDNLCVGPSALKCVGLGGGWDRTVALIARCPHIAR